MVGVAQNDFCADAGEIVRRNCFDRPYRAHRHKDWRVDNPVGRVKLAATGLAVLGGNFESSWFLLCGLHLLRLFCRRALVCENRIGRVKILFSGVDVVLLFAEKAAAEVFF